MRRLLPILLLLSLPGTALAANGGSAAAAAMGNTAAASARGFSAVSVNPALLGLPGNPAFSVALPAARLETGVGPVGLADIDSWGGQTVPVEVREGWLTSIVDAGGQTGTVTGDVNLLGFSVGNFAVRVSSYGVGDAALNADAAELILFGNAGRDGEPREFDLGGSALNGAALSTVAVGGAIPLGIDLPFAPGGAVAVGAAVTFTQGHGMVLARDLGSTFAADPVAGDFAFPVVATRSDALGFEGGSGWGLDLGAAADLGGWSAGATLRNVVQTFSWDTSSLEYHSAEAYFDLTGAGAEFETRPYDQAPDELKAAVEDYTLDPVLELGVARPMGNLLLTGGFSRRFGDGIPVVPESRLAGGAEIRPAPMLALRGGLAWITGGWQASGGAGVGFGLFHVGGAVALQRGDRDAELVMLTLSLGAE